MKNYRLITLLLTAFVALQLTAQSGKIVGTITDGDYNEPMAFANVLIKNTTTCSKCDSKMTVDIIIKKHNRIFTNFIYYMS